MTIRCVNFLWFDSFFLTMLATNITIVAINWELYKSCTYPLHKWNMVDYTVVFTFRLLMFIDDRCASRMSLDLGWSERCTHFYRRVIALSILALLYPFLWAWTIIGTLWFSKTKICLSGGGQKWGFLILLLFSYCGLLCIACVTIVKWFKRRQAYMAMAQERVSISAWGVLLEMIRVPEWTFEASTQEARMAENMTNHPRLFISQIKRQELEASILQLPSLRLNVVPTNCNECLICLEEFQVGNQVRDLPCAHNFHVECIDKWLRHNVSCPRCRSSVFPNLNVPSNVPPNEDESSATVVIPSSSQINQTSS